MRYGARILLTILFGIGLASSGRADPMKIKISFASPYGPYCAGYLIAKERGWFKDLGLEVEDVIMNGDANATRALVTGSADVAMTGPLNIFNAIQNGAQVKWIGSWQPTVDYVVVAPKDVTSLGQLRGKTFAASGPSGLPQVLPNMLFKKFGIPTEGLKFVSVGGHSARLQAVIAGKADAAMVNEFTGLVGERSGAVHVLASISDSFPHLGYTVLAVKDSDLKSSEKEKAFQALMVGSIRGARALKQDPKEGARVLSKYMKGVDVTLLEGVLERLIKKDLLPTDGGLNDEVVKYTSKLEFDLGETKRLFSANEVTDDAVVKAALRQLENSK